MKQKTKLKNPFVFYGLYKNNSALSGLKGWELYT